jgi:glycosyltransferase involved in cell wall biosynthesis
MLKLIKITHLTSAHKRYDTRIFIKMCCSLSKVIEYNVSLVVADGIGNEKKNDVTIYDIGEKTGGRFSRMTKTVKKIFLKAKELDSDIYHLHDPELIPIGLRLKKMGKKVIFDAHEDLPKQLLGKPYLNVFFKTILSKLFLIYEKKVFKKFDYLIAATPIIRDKILKINQNTIDVNNFPILEGALLEPLEWEKKKNRVCYVGGIDKSRGIYEIIESLSYTNEITLNLAGNFKQKSDKDNLVKHNSWKKVIDLGYLDKEGVKQVYEESKIGLVTLHPQINYIESLPVKMFEYMEASIPVIASNFSSWESIIKTHKCGICVNPLDPKEIAKAINHLIENEDVAIAMGKNGKKAVLENYNWDNEEFKLLEIYRKLSVIN